MGRAAVDAFNSSWGSGSSNSLSLTIGPAPSSSSQAFVSAAFPTGGNALAPLSIVFPLFGTNLSGSTVVSDQAPPLPTMLGGTTITLGGLALPLFFVSPGQINFQLSFFTTLLGEHGKLLS